MSRASLIAALAVTLVACGHRDPGRPPSVPPDALWVGGADGGAWIACRRSAPSRGEYHCRVYLESGLPEFEGEFVCRGPQRACDLDVTRQDEYEAWDGHDILMHRGATLASQTEAGE